ncbi:hypothetical protein CCR95_17735 [Thiocystis minor]|uniref:hypothetical protein n=1 Tax=Thiocystis minor TaxID=61597 RepID=UPI0019127EC0|nr:hypothetical protein [Thiocystis minor]MBK5965867.1 hypothetical protein [Thiocystis minor]
MRALRQIYDSLPPMIEIPEDLHRRHVEVVFLELEETDTPNVSLKSDWPEGLFERTAGAWHGELLREDQGEYEQRQEIE